MVDARSATSKDFEKAAQRQANSFWVWLVITGIVYFFLRWWAIVPAAMALLRVVQSVSLTNAAGKLRKGTYPIPNPNNGAPDGDIANSEPFEKPPTPRPEYHQPPLPPSTPSPVKDESPVNAGNTGVNQQRLLLAVVFGACLIVCAAAIGIFVSHTGGSSSTPKMATPPTPQRQSVLPIPTSKPPPTRLPIQSPSVDIRPSKPVRHFPGSAHNRIPEPPVVPTETPEPSRALNNPPILPTLTRLPSGITYSAALNLMWFSMPAGGFNSEDAEYYCRTCRFAEKEDWRVPAFPEIGAIVEIGGDPLRVSRDSVFWAISDEGRGLVGFSILNRAESEWRGGIYYLVCVRDY